MERTIEFAEPGEDVRYAIDLANKHKAEVGFLPRTIYEPLAIANRLMIARADKDPVGMLMIGPIKRDTRIYQTIVQADARRVYNGSDLLTLLLATATLANAHRITLWCACDLPANEFWKANGFELDRRRVKSKKHGRLQNEWTKLLPAGREFQAALATDPRTATIDSLAKVCGLTTASRMSMAKKIWKDRR